MRIVKIFNSQDGQSFENKVNKTLSSIITNHKDKQIAKLTFYINSSTKENYQDEYNAISNIILSSFKTGVPAYLIIAQHTENNDDFVIECQLYNKDTAIAYKSILNHHYVVINHQTGKEIISGGILFNEDSLVFNTQRCFDFIEQILMAEDLNFGHIYKQCNYLSNINSTSIFEGEKKTNYSLFQEIKKIFYEESLFINDQPIENITECKFENLLIDFMAFSEHQNVEKINTDSYSSAILYLSPQQDSNINNLRYSNSDKHEMWFTNSISTKNIKENDIEQQTIKNINALSNLLNNNNNKPINQDLNKITSFIKIFIKNKSDIKKVKKIIKDIFPAENSLIINANLSNENQLLEIEGYINPSNL